MHWYVIYTQPRAEKKTAGRLDEAGFEVYCPLREEVRQWSDRKKKVKVPVFNSYVFIRLEDYVRQRVQVLTTPGVSRFLWWLGKPAIVRDEEMNSLRQFLDDYRDTEIQVSYNKGERVEITQGPFKSYKGIIVDMDRKKAMLIIESLGLTLRATLPLHLLKKMSS